MRIRWILAAALVLAALVVPSAQAVPLLPEGDEPDTAPPTLIAPLPEEQVVIEPASQGIDWSVVGIGAAVGSAFALAVLGIRRAARQAPPPTATTTRF